jgi:PAS domain S-box-containing protein
MDTDRQNDRWRDLIELVPAVVYEAEVDPSRRFRYVSPQIERLLGFPAERFLADPGLRRQLMHPDDRAEVSAQESIELDGDVGSIARAVEYRLCSAEESWVWVRDEARLVTEADGDRYWIGVLSDVSREHQSLERASDELEMSRRDVGRLLAGIHEHVATVERLRRSASRYRDDHAAA